MQTKKLRVLIAEDEEACRKIIYRFLLPFGECEACADGSEAVQRVRAAAAAGKYYDLICLDIHMPKLDGHAAAAQIRALEAEHNLARAKIMVITALGDTVNLTNAFETACDAYIVKPFTYAKLIEQLSLMGLIAAPAVAGNMKQG